VLLFGLAMLLLNGACSDVKEPGVTTPPVATLAPTPAPTPEPTPTPTPTPIPPNANGLGLFIEYFPRNSECVPGVRPTGTDQLRVGCSIEVRATVRDRDGNDVPYEDTGNDVEWKLTQGEQNVTLPWDSAPWKRWLTGVHKGHFRIEVTLTLKRGQLLVGELRGEVVP
jgi:hypothetical protein